MNETLRVKVEADIKGLERELNQAEKLLQQHERNYKRIQSTISGNVQKSNDLQNSIQRLNSEFDKGQISESRYAKETDRLSAELREVNNETKDYQKELKRLDGEIDRITASTSQYQNAAGKVAGASQQAASGVNQLGTATRVNAVPAMTSFSQVVQDAPYGIRGVANNIQQLTMQFGYLSKSSGGAVGALKAMGASLMGPAGILMAVSLVTTALITYGDKLFAAKDETEKLKDETEKAKEELDKFIDSLNNLDKVKISATVEADQAKAEFNALMRQLTDTANDSGKRMSAALSIKSKFPDILKDVEALTIAEKGLTEAQRERINSLINERATSGTALEQQKKNLEEIEKLRSKERSILDKLAPAQQELTKAEEQYNRALNNSSRKEIVDSYFAASERAKVSVQDLTKELNELQGRKQSLELENVELQADVTLVAEDLDTSKIGGKSGEAVRVPVKAVMELETAGGDAAIQAQMAFVRMLEEEIAIMKQAQSLFPEFSEAHRSLGESITFAEDRLSGFNNTLQEEALANAEKFAAMYESIETDSVKMTENLQQRAMILQGVFNTMGNSLIDNLGKGEEGLHDFVKTLFSVVSKVIVGLIAQSIGNAILAGTQTAASSGPAAAFVLPGLVMGATGVVKSAFSQIPQFADGGIVGGHSYTGDKILARLNSGELILNHADQRSLLGMMNAPQLGEPGSPVIELGGGFVIEGDTLRMVLDRTNQSNSRYN